MLAREGTRGGGEGVEKEEEKKGGGEGVEKEEEKKGKEKERRGGAGG